MNNDSKNPLRDFLDQAKTGIDSMRKKKAPTIDDQAEVEQDTITGEKTETIRAIDNDEFVIENEADNSTPSAPSKKGSSLRDMPLKKKLLLIAIVVVAGLVVKNSLVSAPTSEPAAVQPESSLNKDGVAGSDFGSGSLGDGLPNPLGDAKAHDPAVGKTLEALDLDGPFQVKPQDAITNEPIVSGQSAAELNNDSFGFPEANTTSAPAAVEPTDTIAEAMLVPGNGFGDRAKTGAAAMPATASSTPEANPFGAQSTPLASNGDSLTPPPSTGKSDTVLAGTPFQNPDSSVKPSQQGSTDTQTSELKAKLAAKDEQIKTLERQLQDAKAKKPATPKVAVTQVKHAPTSKHVPTVARQTATRATPVARVVPRPKLCVKAVAPPARNCSTCVAHAFIVDSGVENMVGQGDHLNGYRVSITGDRLDLQNSDGQVVHKFWSSTNGCPSF